MYKMDKKNMYNIFSLTGKNEKPLYFFSIVRKRKGLRLLNMYYHLFIRITTLFNFNTFAGGQNVTTRESRKPD